MRCLTQGELDGGGGEVGVGDVIRAIRMATRRYVDRFEVEDMVGGLDDIAVVDKLALEDAFIEGVEEAGLLPWASDETSRRVASGDSRRRWRGGGGEGHNLLRLL